MEIIRKKAVVISNGCDNDLSYGSLNKLGKTNNISRFSPVYNKSCVDGTNTMFYHSAYRQPVYSGEIMKKNKSSFRFTEPGGTATNCLTTATSEPVQNFYSNPVPLYSSNNKVYAHKDISYSNGYQYIYNVSHYPTLAATAAKKPLLLRFSRRIESLKIEKEPLNANYFFVDGINRGLSKLSEYIVKVLKDSCLSNYLPDLCLFRNKRKQKRKRVENITKTCNFSDVNFSVVQKNCLFNVCDNGVNHHLLYLQSAAANPAHVGVSAIFPQITGVHRNSLLRKSSTKRSYNSCAKTVVSRGGAQLNCVEPDCTKVAGVSTYDKKSVDSYKTDSTNCKVEIFTESDNKLTPVFPTRQSLVLHSVNNGNNSNNNNNNEDSNYAAENDNKKKVAEYFDLSRDDESVHSFGCLSNRSSYSIFPTYFRDPADMPESNAVNPYKQKYVEYFEISSRKNSVMDSANYLHPNEKSTLDSSTNLSVSSLFNSVSTMEGGDNNRYSSSEENENKKLCEVSIDDSWIEYVRLMGNPNAVA